MVNIVSRYRRTAGDRRSAAAEDGDAGLATAALALDRKTFRVEFDQAKCIACEHCINACPVRAMEAHY